MFSLSAQWPGNVPHHFCVRSKLDEEPCIFSFSWCNEVSMNERRALNVQQPSRYEDIVKQH